MNQAYQIPSNATDLEPLKLVTMTVSSNIDRYFNLDVISKYIVLDETLVGVHYRDTIRGQQSTDAFTEPNNDEESEQAIDSVKSGRFKNQCTFIINDGTKIINSKLFNNGKMVNVGCKDPNQASFTANVILSRIVNMKGYIIYNIPKELKFKSIKDLKKFFKDDLKKKFGLLIVDLVKSLNMSTDLKFLELADTEQAFELFANLYHNNPSFVKDIMYLYAIIGIFKCYYNEMTIHHHFTTDEFQSMLKKIAEATDLKSWTIKCEFPSYLNNGYKIKFNTASVKIVLINKSTKCGYYINRQELQNILEKQSDIIQCKFDKSKYPGVLAQYRTKDDKIIKIIVFNTGKINITAACTHEQVHEGYLFIQEICKRYFKELLLVSEYQNKKKEYEDSLPEQYYVGVVNDQTYYLLHKPRILANPRNIRFLHKMGLLDKYT